MPRVLQQDLVMSGRKGMSNIGIEEQIWEVYRKGVRRPRRWQNLPT